MLLYFCFVHFQTYSEYHSFNNIASETIMLMIGPSITKPFVEDEIVSRTDEYFYFTYSLLLIIKLMYDGNETLSPEEENSKKHIVQAVLHCMLAMSDDCVCNCVCCAGSFFQMGMATVENIIFMTFLFDSKGNLTECKPEKR